MTLQLTKTILLGLFFLLCLTSYSSPAMAGDQYEPDNSSNTATLLKAGEDQLHSIDPVGDMDWLYFVLTRTEYVEIESPGVKKTRLLLYDDHLSLIQNSWYPARIRRKLEPGRYYLRIQTGDNPNEIIDTYYISLSTTSSNGDSFETDNRPEDATTILAGSTQEHSIIPAGDEDWAVFNLTKNEFVELKTTGLSKTRIFLYDEHLSLVASSPGFQDGLIQKQLDPGKYYVRISNHYNTIEIDKYYLTLVTTSSNGDSYETDNRAEDARAIGNNTAQEHSLFPAGDKDWVTFTLQEDDTVDLKTSKMSETIITVYDSHLALIKISSFWDSSIQVPLVKGTYYVSISGSQSYTTVNKYNFIIKGNHIQQPNVTSTQPIIPVLHLLLLH